MAPSMLSYRHGYHAGNLADVLKHTVLTCVLRAMSRKAKPLLYLDTHAGAGRYDLRSRAAASRGEFRDGIDRLRAAAALDGDAVPADVRAYLDLVEAALRDARNPGYPSGADIAARLLRRTDRLVLAERHPADAAAASKHFASARNVTLFEGDGYACLRSHLPPREGRGLVLIDPAFELRGEGDHLVAGLREALARFRHGTYLVWYPRAGKLDWPRLVDRVTRLGAPQLVEVTLGAPNARGGAIPSAVLLLNPPYSALAPLEATHAWLAERVADGDGAWRWLAQADAPSTR